MDRVCRLADVPAHLTLYRIALLFMRTYLWSFFAVDSSIWCLRLLGELVMELYFEGVVVGLINIVWSSDVRCGTVMFGVLVGVCGVVLGGILDGIRWLVGVL